MREKVIAHFCVMILTANFLSQPAVAPATPAPPNLNYTRSTDSPSREMTATTSATSEPSLTFRSMTPSVSQSFTLTMSPEQGSLSHSMSMSLSSTYSVTPSSSASQSSSTSDSNRRSTSNSPTRDVTASRTITPPPTPTQSSTATLSQESSISESPSMSTTASKHVSKSSGTPSSSYTKDETMSRSPSQEQSASRTQTVTPPPTPTPSPSASSEISLTKTPILSSSPTITATISWQQSMTETVSPSLSMTQSPTQSFSKEPTLTHSPSSSSSRSPFTLSNEPTVTATPRFTVSPTLKSTPTWSLTPTLTTSQSSSLSVSLSEEISATRTQSPSLTTSTTLTDSATPSEEISNSPSDSATPTVSTTEDLSLSDSPTISTTPSKSSTPSSSESSSPTQTASVTSSYSLTLTQSPSVTISNSLSVSMSVTLSTSPTVSQSETEETSWSKTSTITISIGTISGVATGSVDVTPSRTKGTPTTTASLTSSYTLTTSLSNSLSVSNTMSQSMSQSDSTSVSETLTSSTTISDILTPTATMTPTRSSSSEPSETKTLTLTQTPSFTDSASPTAMNSFTETQTITEDGTATMSYELTTSVQPPTTTHVPTPTWTLPTRCPTDCMKGTCRQITAFVSQSVFYCVCQASSATGYWSGSERGGPCDKCATGYYGLGCLNACPGGACSICSGHGSCDDGLYGTGTCTCFNDPVRGFWQGFACTVCQSAKYGLSCNKNCTCGSQGTCNSGTVGDGSCKCNAGWIGQNCTTCDISTNTECDSFRTCPGDGNCNGNGACNYNISDTGVCDCYPFYAGLDCSLHCSNNCSGHGTCSDGRYGTGICACNARYGSADCSTCQAGYYGTGSSCVGVCPGSETVKTNACSNQGTCTDTGICLCTGTWGGTKCNLVCPTASANSSLVCAGHGVCNSNGLCVCDQDEINGFWYGAACEVCDPDYGATSCRTKCPTYNTDVQTCGATYGYGLCNNITATCDCSASKCGESCQVDTVNGECPKCNNTIPGDNVQYYGFDCDKICLCENGICNDGVGGDGTCSCSSGWSGQYCNITCPGGIIAPCSNNGACVQATSRCLCNASYAGSTCSLVCPRTSSGVCNGTGTCFDGSTGNGTCQCADGWVWPQTTCTTVCQCNGHGTCYFPNATCVCDQNFEGSHCERCVSGKFGTKCDKECIAGKGVTVGYTCLCLNGYAGANGCSISCPNTTLGVCNGQGTCSNTTGTCRCADTWLGPGCTCNNIQCRNANAFTTCDTTSGVCICVTGRTGAACASCVFGYYGAPVGGVSCATLCDCSSNGPCDINTGVCSCFSDSTNGYWTGGTCNQCAAGYMGTRCNQLSNAITQSTDLVRRLSGSVVSCTTYHAYLDAVHRLLYVGTSCFQSRFNVTSVTPFSPDSMNFNTTVDGSEINGDVVDLQVSITNPDELLFILQQNSTANAFYPTLFNASMMPFLASVNLLQDVTVPTNSPFSGTTLFAYFDQVSGNVCTMPSGQAYSRLYCKKLTGNVTAVLLTGFSYQTSAFVKSLSLIVLGGLANAITCSFMTVLLDASTAGTQFQLDLVHHVASANLSTCTAVNIVTATDDVIFFSIKAPTNYIGGYNFSTRTFFTGSLIGGETAGTAMTYNSRANIGYVVYNTLLVKFEVVPSATPGGPSVVNAYGQAYTSTTIKLFVQDDFLQLVYAPVVVSTGVQVMRFLLVEVHSIYPIVADRAGGALITVTGKGFRNVPGAVCLFDKDSVSFYQFINSTTVVCQAPQKISSEVCVTQLLEISINSIQTANLFSIERPASPTLLSVTPEFVRVGDVGKEVVIQGRGLTDSNYSRCRFFDPVSNQSALSIAIYSATNYTFTCVAPTVTSPWSSQTYIHITLDGFVFSASTLKFLFVGEATGILIDTASFSAVSSVRSFLTPTLTVYTVDPNQNKLLTVDTELRFSVVSAPNATTGSQPWVLQNPNATSVNGVATFSSLSLKDPPYGDFVFSVRMGNFITNFSLVIQPGEVVRLIVTTQPQLTAADTVIPGSSIPRPMDIVAVDAGGNDAASASSNRASFSLIRTYGGKLLLNESVLLGSALFSATGSANIGSPVVTPMFGFPYVIFFSYDLNPMINVSSNPFYAGCATTQYFVNGTQACQACNNDLYFCNGTDILVAKAKSWRANAAAAFFYSCPIDGACLEGGSCAEGYEGPLCGICSPGYGTDFTNKCGQCPNRAVSYVIFILVVLFQLVFLVFVSIAFIQNWQALNSLFTQAVITMCISFSHFQFLSLIGKLDLEWTPLVQNVLSFLGMLFAFELHRVRAVNCILVSNGIDAVWFAMIYSFIVICAIPILSLVVHRILRVFPTLLLTGYALNARAVMESRADALAKAKLVKRARNEDGSMYIKEHQRKGIVLNVAQVVVTFCFQTSCRSALQLFQCSTIQYSSTQVSNYLTADLSVSCDTSNYQTVLGYSMFLVVFYVVAVPVVFIFGVAYSRKRHTEEDYRLYTSFTTLGTRDMAFFWNGLLFCRRAALIAIELFLDYPLQGWMGMWLVTLSAWAEHYALPWEKGKHMNIERAGFMCAVFIANLGIIIPLIYNNAASKTVEALLMAALCALFAFTLYAGLYKSVRELQQRVKEHNMRDTEDGEDREAEVGFTDVLRNEAKQVTNVMKNMADQAKNGLLEARGKMTHAMEEIANLAKLKQLENSNTNASQALDKSYASMPVRSAVGAMARERSPSVNDDAAPRRSGSMRSSADIGKPPSIVFPDDDQEQVTRRRFQAKPPEPLRREASGHFDEIDDVESMDSSNEDYAARPNTSMAGGRSAPLLNRSALSMLRASVGTSQRRTVRNDDGKSVDPASMRRMELEKDIDDFIAAKGFGLYQQDAAENSLYDTRDASPLAASPIAQRAAAMRALMKKQGTIPKALQDVIGDSSDEDDDSDDRSADSDL